MLVEFSVKNYMSIKDEIRLSLVARPSPDRRDTHLTIPEVIEGVRSTPLVNSTAIYGPNAAGKTNLILALAAMQEIVLRSSQGLEELPAVPFAFDPDCQTSPTVFEVIFILDGVRYQYGFSVTSSTVIDEWLFAWPRGRVQMWFERNNGIYDFGQKLIGPKQVWEQATRSNALFLSTAVSLNSKQLKPIFDWFRKTLHIATVGGWGNGFTMARCSDDSHGEDINKHEIINFLNRSDLSIKDIRIVDEKFTTDQIPVEIPSAAREELVKDLVGKNVQRAVLTHNTGKEKDFELDLELESHGTQRIFALAGPWLDILKNGCIVVMDELEDSLHPALVRFLVDNFHNPLINRNGAQLIFTTHNTSILSQHVFRRDQIWFCERNKGQETQLFPLTQFHPRMKFENLERSYLTGRYGALPYLRQYSEAATQ